MLFLRVAMVSVLGSIPSLSVKIKKKKQKTYKWAVWLKKGYLLMSETEKVKKTEINQPSLFGDKMMKWQTVSDVINGLLIKRHGKWNLKTLLSTKNLAEKLMLSWLKKNSLN